MLLDASRIAAGQFASDVGWTNFKRRFPTQQGRVVDTGNLGISYSEGQAVGMFLAVRHPDVEVFGRMSEWTQQNLAVRSESLLAWRYQPDETS
ncbi:glycosyl hydrolase family 8 [Sediminicoccus sp. BL-A-41-H5]|uniref:glycosyl hydrolase family 8 n=1 Tax=Sediminicoccus sp. BL-A-41-H5 TaxID=3421106 RepID=UPI003D67DE47